MRTVSIVLGVVTLSGALVAQAKIPTGTIIPVMLSTSVDTKNCTPGQRLSARVMQDVELGDESRIKAGTRVTGEVVAVKAAQGAQPATVTLRFDQIEISGQKMPVVTDLRALASLVEVAEAHESISGDDEPASTETSVQIGGDVVYRGGGPVVGRGAETVGEPVAGGVVSHVSPGGNCRGAAEESANPQALWLFSNDACGVYGYAAVIAQSGRANPQGGVVLASTTPGNFKIQSGSGLLLQVEESQSGIVSK